MNISNVDSGHRILLKGTYNPSVYVCRNCGNNMLQTSLSNCVGFSAVRNFTVIVIECDQCFKSFYYHASDDTYNQFKDWFGFGWSRFYTKLGKRRKIILNKVPEKFKKEKNK